MPRGGRAVTFADTVEASGSQWQPGAAAVALENSGAEGAVQLGARTFADIVKGTTWQPATAAAPQQGSGGAGRFEQAPRVTFAGVDSSSGGPTCQPGAGATGSLPLLPGGGAGSGQLTADPGRQEEAEVDALRAEVADLRDKLAQVEAILGRL